MITDINVLQRIIDESPLDATHFCDGDNYWKLDGVEWYWTNERVALQWVNCSDESIGDMGFMRAIDDIKQIVELSAK